ncbi:MAG: hypothetical protein H7245_24805 [Candidatus Saccharibacteria bacterium]|nr:hypothetical protein [Pseudorhodobacter sp.]
MKDRSGAQAGCCGVVDLAVFDDDAAIAGGGGGGDESVEYIGQDAFRVAVECGAVAAAAGPGGYEAVAGLYLA